MQKVQVVFPCFVDGFSSLVQYPSWSSLQHYSRAQSPSWSPLPLPQPHFLSYPWTHSYLPSLLYAISQVYFPHRHKYPEWPNSEWEGLWPNFNQLYSSQQFSSSAHQWCPFREADFYLPNFWQGNSICPFFPEYPNKYLCFVRNHRDDLFLKLSNLDLPILSIDQIFLILFIFPHLKLAQFLLQKMHLVVHSFNILSRFGLQLQDPLGQKFLSILFDLILSLNGDGLKFLLYFMQPVLVVLPGQHPLRRVRNSADGMTNRSHFYSI